MARARHKGLLSGSFAPMALLILATVALSAACGDAPAQRPSGDTAVIPTTAAKGTSLTQAIPTIDKGQTIEAQAEDVMLSPPARLLAERYMCVCGCGDILATCSCNKTPGSRDMKQLLQKLVDEGKSPSEIKTEMVAVYGQAALP